MTGRMLIRSETDKFGTGRDPGGINEGRRLCDGELRPNRFSQEIKNLQPGRLYSFYMFSGDRKDMSKKEEHAVRIQFENATLIPEKGYTYVHTNVGGSRAYPPYSEEGSAWLNYHYRVFRANGNSAKLSVSDWTSGEEPDGPIGQELMYNFISVQPYFSVESNP